MLVTARIINANPKHIGYPLLEGDLLLEDKAGGFTKVCPGLAIAGFRLEAKQVASSLRKVDFEQQGLNYTIKGDN